MIAVYYNVECVCKQSYLYMINFHVKIPSNWGKFLKLEQNKAKLVHFLAERIGSLATEGKQLCTALENNTVCAAISTMFMILKSVQSALSDLLTTSATHGTFSRPSTKRGLILIGLELNTNARESLEHC